METEPSQSPLRGAIYMLLGSACFAAMGALVKRAGEELSPLFVVFVRSVVIALVVFAVTRVQGHRLRVVNRRMMLGRCVTGFVAMGCYFYSLSLLPLATAVTIQYLAPVFVALLSRRALGEAVSSTAWLATLAAFGGSALLVGPNVQGIGVGASLALCSAFLASLAYLAVRELRRTDEPQAIVAAFAWFSAICAAPSLLWVQNWPSAEQWLVVLGVGLSAYGGQLAMTHAYRVARAAFVSALSYSTVALGALIGIFTFGEWPSLSDWTGMGVIAAAGIWLSLAEMRAERSTRKSG